MWEPPTSTNAKGNGYQVSKGKKILTLPGQVVSSTAPTAKPGESRSLNPEFSLWLLGYPKGWLD
jgi:hypothetical protein